MESGCSGQVSGRSHPWGPLGEGWTSICQGPHLGVRTSPGLWRQRCIRSDAEPPVPKERLPPQPRRRVPELQSLHWLPEFSSGRHRHLPVVASGLTSRPDFRFPFPASLTLGNKGESCRSQEELFFFLAAHKSPDRDPHHHPCESKALLPCFRQGAAFRFLSRPDVFLGMQMIAAQNKEKQMEMRIVITVKGVKGCVSVSMASAIFQGFIIPAVKIHFTPGSGKSEPSVTESLYIVKDSTFDPVGNATPFQRHRMLLCPLRRPPALAASLTRLLRPAPWNGEGAAPRPLQRLLWVLDVGEEAWFFVEATRWSSEGARLWGCRWLFSDHQPTSSLSRIPGPRVTKEEKRCQPKYTACSPPWFTTPRPPVTSPCENPKLS